MNIRTTLAKLLSAFDFRFAPGEIGKGIESSKEHFTFAPGELMMVFTRRK